MKRETRTAACGAVLLFGCSSSFAARPDGGAALLADAGADAGRAPVSIAAAPTVGLAHEDARRIDHLVRARELERASDLAGALAEARRAAWDRPDTEALEAVARLAERKADRALAALALAALAAARPQDPAPLLRLARLHLEAREPAPAEAAALEAMQRAPLSAQGWHLRGRAELQRGAHAEAARDLERAVRLDARDAWAWNNLGYARLLAGEPGRAVVAFERARALAPQLACVHNNLGVAYEQLGRTDEAQLAFGRALDLDPSHAHAAANFARAAEALGWMGPAVEEAGEGADAGLGAESGEGFEGFEGEWSATEGDDHGAALARSWLLEAGAKGADDDPSGSDLREPPAFARPVGRPGDEEPRQAW